ncbi:GDSL-like lipase/Acylhydrolase family protein [Sarocladium implicatum]|nr:GDSL-like lipase/Acylhydrolase family protein [Sarocladium implicatum]
MYVINGVKSLKDPEEVNLALTTAAQDVEGHSGYQVHQIHDKAKDAVKFKPNVVVINAGTNDCIGHNDNNNQHNRLKSMIEYLWNNVSKDTVVIVSTLLPLSGSGSDVVDMVNDNYRRMVSGLSASGFPIYLADMKDVQRGDIIDGIHPGDAGHKKMAAAFWAGIRAAERDGLIKNPGKMDDGINQGGNCRKEAGKGVYAGGLTQTGSGEHDGIYRHASQDMGTVLTITSAWDRNQWRFARLFRQDRDDLVGWFEDNGKVKYGCWRNDGGGKFTKINDLDVKDNCPIEGIHFVDVSFDSTVTVSMTSPASHQTAMSLRPSTNGTETEQILLLLSILDSGNRASLVLSCDGRCDYIALADNGDARIWRNGWIDDKPAYWQALGLRFTGKGMGDLRGVRFEDINVSGDGRDDWLWVSNTGRTTTWTAARSCAKGKEGDGLNIAWRQGFNGNANSGPTHMGGFGDDVRNRIHFARIYGEVQDWGLLGRQDYVFMDHKKINDNTHEFKLKVFKNVGRGGTKMVADGNKYLLKLTVQGRDDYVWTWSHGAMTIYPNAGKTYVSESGGGYWGPSADIFNPNNIVGKNLDRRDLHLADWDGGMYGKCDIIWTDPDNSNKVSVFINKYNNGNWAWSYQANPAGALSCPEKRGRGIDDLPVRFADIMEEPTTSASRRTAEPTVGSMRATEHSLASTSGRAPRATTVLTFVSPMSTVTAKLMVDKSTGDGHVYYNLGRRDVGGSQYEWEQKSGGGPFYAYSGNAAGTCNFFPDLDGNGRADQHNILGTWTNETWYNMCEGDRQGDDPNMGNPGLPDVAMPPTPGSGSGGDGKQEFILDPPDWAISNPGTPSTMEPPPLSENCFTQAGRQLPDIFVFPQTYGNGGGKFKCIGKWNRGIFIDRIEADVDEWSVRRLTFRYTDGTTDVLGGDNYNDGHQKWHGSVELNPTRDPWSRFDIAQGGWENGIGFLVWASETSCRRFDKPLDDPFCTLHRGKYLGGAKEPDFPAPPSRGLLSRGMLMGIEGMAGDSIDTITPLFSNGQTVALDLNDFTFSPTIEQLNQGDASKVMSMTHDYWIHENNTPNEALGIYTMGISYEYGQKTTVSTEDGREIGSEIGTSYSITMKTEVGVPEIEKISYDEKAEVTAKFTLKRITKTVNSNENSWSKSVSKQHAVRTKIPAYHKLVCQAVLMQSDLALTWTGTHKFANGADYKYPIDGIMQSRSASQSRSMCRLVAPDKEPNPPAEARVIKTNGAQGSYCPNGSYAGPVDMSDEDFAKECKMAGIGDYYAGINV